MLTLQAIRRLQHRRSTRVRDVMLLLLAMMTFAAMPKWVTHSDNRAHETMPALTADTLSDHARTGFDGADELDASSPDPTHSHVHDLTGAPATLPATFADLCRFAIPGNACPAGRSASLADGPLTSLHRPPIV